MTKIAVNELSVIPQDQPSSVVSILHGFVDLLSFLQSAEIYPLFSRAFLQLKIGNDCTVGEWVADEKNSRNVRNLLRVYVTKHGNIDLHIKDDGAVAECRIEGKESKGLLYAALGNRCVLSLATETWKRSPIQTTVVRLREQGLEEQQIEVDNVWHAETARGLGEKLIRRRVEEAKISCGCELVALLDSFGCVRLGARARDQLLQMTGTEQVFSFVTDHLKVLVIRAGEWLVQGTSRFEDGLSIRHSGESAPTMQQYGDRRVFVASGGERLMCEWHTKIGVDSWRIHYLADRARGWLFIGYVGPHLPTVGDPT